MDEIKPSLIRIARLKKNLTQEQLAAGIGVSKASVSSWEKGQILPDSRKLHRLTKALHPHFSVTRYLREIGERAGAA